MNQYIHALRKHREFQVKQTNGNFIADAIMKSKSLHSSKIYTILFDCTLAVCQGKRNKNCESSKFNA